jgi:2-oxoglutarate ferredoxin oxidoreductase subunit gamma
MKHEMLFSGIGGQGIMMLGEILCNVAVQAGYQVTFAPFYGQEKRGGRTMCNVVIADSMESPIISEAELMLVMDEKSFHDFEGQMAKDGLLLINSSMIDSAPTRSDYRVAKIPFYDIATNKIGNSKTANMVALGTLIRQLPFLSLEQVEKEVEKAFAAKPKVIPANLKALRAGYEYTV